MNAVNKNLQLRKQNSNLYGLNRKLVLTTKSLKKKIIELKERYNKKIKKAQKFGLDTLEMTIPRFDTEMTYDLSKEDIPKEYLDDFNSNDSYEEPKAKNQISAYKNYGKSRTLLIDEGIPAGRVQTEMAIHRQDSIEHDEVTSGKSKNSFTKSSKRISEKMKENNDYKTTESPRHIKEEDLSGLMRPSTSYKKKGLITKININDQGRDLLAGRKRVLKRPVINTKLMTNKGRNRSALD